MGFQDPSIPFAIVTKYNTLHIISVFNASLACASYLDDQVGRVPLTGGTLLEYTVLSTFGSLQKILIQLVKLWPIINIMIFVHFFLKKVVAVQIAVARPHLSFSNSISC